jgi:hypothetical protein
MAYKEEVGYRYGRLVVLEYAGSYKGVAFWTVQCDCSDTPVDHPIAGRSLRSHNTTSCGCYQKSQARAYRQQVGKRNRIVRAAFKGTKMGRRNEQSKIQQA